MSSSSGSSPGASTDTHDVLPPYRRMSSLWHGVEPRTPWNVTRITEESPRPARYAAFPERKSQDNVTCVAWRYVSSNGRESGSRVLSGQFCPMDWSCSSSGIARRARWSRRCWPSSTPRSTRRTTRPSRTTSHRFTTRTCRSAGTTTSRPCRRLIRVVDGNEVERTVGWLRTDWQRITGIDALGQRPAGDATWLRIDERRSQPRRLASRTSSVVACCARGMLELADLDDEMEVLFDRGVTDGLPVTPPTVERVLKMLEGTTRAPDEVVAVVAPDLVEVTVEKVAINAVMAGCRPEYLPWVIAALQAVCTDEFNIHGVLGHHDACRTGADLQRTRNSGDRDEQRRQRVRTGQPRQHDDRSRRCSWSSATSAADDPARSIVPRTATRASSASASPRTRPARHSRRWLSAAASAADDDTVTVFAGEGPRCIVDQLGARRRPVGQLLRRVPAHGASPEAGHRRSTACWSSDPSMRGCSPRPDGIARCCWRQLHDRLKIHGSELVRGADDMAEGVPDRFANETIGKFRADGLLLVHAGGGAGLFSAMIGGWANGSTGSQPVTRRVQR